MGIPFSGDNLIRPSVEVRPASSSSRAVVHDGNFDTTHFQSEVFNTRCASPLVAVAFGMIYEDGVVPLSVIDMGGANGALTCKVHDTLQGAMNGDFGDTVEFTVVDIDAEKIRMGEAQRGERSQINYRVADLTDEASVADLFDKGQPILMFTRAVTQYMHDPEMSEHVILDEDLNGRLTSAQRIMYGSYLKQLPIGSCFVDILSTGVMADGSPDYYGMSIFSHMLYQLTLKSSEVDPTSTPKIDHFLAPEDVRAAVVELEESGKRYAVDPHNPFGTITGSGRRGEGYMYKRYCLEGESRDDFHRRYLAAYEAAIAAHPALEGYEDYSERNSGMVRVVRDPLDRDVIQDVIIDVVYKAVSMRVIPAE